MRTSWLIALAALVVSVVLVAGCGGHGGVVPPGGGGAALATFVGRAVCATCHGDINAEYGSYPDGPYVPGTKNPGVHVWANFVGSAHGQDMRSKGSGNRNVQDDAGCQPCHTVGYGEDSGYTNGTDTPQFEGIGCEECHGRGSVHAGDPASSNISRVPVATETCWDCHNNTYKILRAGAPPMVDDGTWYNTNPGSVGPKYRQALFLLGYEGYLRPQMESPHALINNTCVTCHLNENSGDFHGTEALRGDLEACVTCHGSAAEAQALLADFDEEIVDLLIELGGDNGSGEPNSKPTGGLIGAYATANGIVLTSNDQKDLQAVKNYKGARNNYYLVYGGCYVHNPNFARQVLQDAKDLVTP